MMPAKELGTKHTCFQCSTKFYDLKKPEPLCPKCGADQRESPALKAPEKERRRVRAAAVAPVEPTVEEPILEEEQVDEDEDEELEETEESFDDED